MVLLGGEGFEKCWMCDNTSHGGFSCVESSMVDIVKVKSMQKRGGRFCGSVCRFAVRGYRTVITMPHDQKTTFMEDRLI